MPRASTVGLVLVAVLLSPAARAEPMARSGSAETELRYAGYVAGLAVFSLNVKANLAADRYRMETRYNPVGVLQVLVSGELHTLAVGHWTDGRAHPERYQTWGIWRGDAHDTQIDYQAGTPLIRKLIPPIASDRQHVPRPDQLGTIDTLSGFAFLARQVNATGRCDGVARLFDGRRLSEVSVTHGGEEILAPEQRSSFAGPALRCEISSQMLGGFLLGDGPNDASSKTSGSIWFGRPHAGAPMLPVRMSFHLRLFGETMIYLVRGKSSPR